LTTRPSDLADTPVLWRAGALPWRSGLRPSLPLSPYLYLGAAAADQVDHPGHCPRCARLPWAQAHPARPRGYAAIFATGGARRSHRSHARLRRPPADPDHYRGRDAATPPLRRRPAPPEYPDLRCARCHPGGALRSWHARHYQGAASDYWAGEL